MDDAAIVHRIFDALDVGDFERFTSFFAPDAVIWHNFDNQDTPVTETVAILQDLRKKIRDLRYSDRRYISIPGGAVAQHVVRATTLGGDPIELHAMLHVYIEGGLVRRIEEYLDLSQSSAMLT